MTQTEVPEIGDVPASQPGTSADAALRELERALTAIRDPALRLRRMARYIRDADPTEIAWVIARAAQTCIDGDWRQVHVSFAHWLLHARPRPQFPVGHWPLPVDELAPPGLKIAEVIAAARRLDLPFSAHLLREAFATTRPEQARLLQLHPSMDKLSLGWRRERARGTDAQQLQFLLLDTTPAVVQILAENPRVLETHAVQIAGLRPQHPWALQSLLLPIRWLTNSAVLEAMVRNNSTPGWLVLLLAPLLPRRTQMALVHVAWIDPEVLDILGQWHGIAIVRLSTREPGEAYMVIEEGDIAEAIAEIVAEVSD